MIHITKEIERVLGLEDAKRYATEVGDKEYLSEVERLETSIKGEDGHVLRSISTGNLLTPILCEKKRLFYVVATDLINSIERNLCFLSKSVVDDVAEIVKREAKF